MNRAYSALDIKSVNDGERVITGIATTPSPDRMGDIVEPLGAEFAGEIPALWQHNHDQPIGHVKFGNPAPPERKAPLRRCIVANKDRD